ncbi:hypothetical protein MNBD_CHLOROFLEXI01-1836 [hydrothermal vent metagenome]|uniref:Uncharacterized protein n=1 Tax=hydrothermal vent metagenome TaxID=652676 RepID=A0A3B0UJC4_9ZZZZ
MSVAWYDACSLDPVGEIMKKFLGFTGLSIILFVVVSGVVLARENVADFWKSNIQFGVSSNKLADDNLIEQAETEQQEVRNIVQESANHCIAIGAMGHNCFEETVITILSSKTYDYANTFNSFIGTIEMSPEADNVHIISFEVYFDNVMWGGGFAIDKSGNIVGITSGQRWQLATLDTVSSQLRYSLDFVEALSNEQYNIEEIYIRQPTTTSSQPPNGAPSTMDWPPPNHFVIVFSDSSNNLFFLQSVGFDMRLESIEDGEFPDDFVVHISGQPIDVNGRDAVWSIDNTNLDPELAKTYSMPEQMTQLTWSIQYSGIQDFNTPLYNLIVTLEGTGDLDSLVTLAESLP